MKPFDVLTCADLCADFILTDEDTTPEYGQVEKWIADYALLMGGSCSIFACQSAKLGLKTAVVGKVGQDAFGQMILQALESSGVDTRFVPVEPSLKTGVTVILNNMGRDRAMLTYAGTIDAVYPADVTDDLLSQSRHLHIGSYYLLNNLRPHYADIARRAKALGLTISLDTNWDPDNAWQGLDELLPLVDVFLPNENELLAITGESSVEAALDVMSARVPVVAVKMGAEGALIARASERLRVSALRVDALVDTVGAGDSFDGGFLYGYLTGQPLETCGRIGCICGSLNTQGQGGTAAQPDLETLKKYL